MKIAILGAGAFGTALGGILANNGYDIDYYDSKIEREKLSDVLLKVKFIILCIPSKAVPYVLPHLPKNIPLIIATKGILADAVFLNFKDYMILSGPGFADDIKAKKDTYFTITDKRIEELFNASYIHFDYTDDRKGVLMCGALKNVYAIYAGFEDYKPKTKKMEEYIDRAASEMKQILKINEANPITVDCACGIDDLILTCSKQSRNFEFGQRLRLNSNYQPEKTVEGVSALKRIKRGEIILPEDLNIMNKIIEMSDKWA